MNRQKVRRTTQHKPLDTPLVTDFIRDLQFEMDRLPSKDSEDSARLAIWDGSNGDTEYWISYDDLETDEEVDRREALKLSAEEAIEKRERATMAKLMTKYGIKEAQ